MLMREREKPQRRHPFLLLLHPFPLPPSSLAVQLFSLHRVYARRCRRFCSRCDFILDHTHTRIRMHILIQHACWTALDRIQAERVRVSVSARTNGHARMHDSKRTRSARDNHRVEARTVSMCVNTPEDTVTYALNECGGTARRDFVLRLIPDINVILSIFPYSCVAVCSAVRFYDFYRCSQRMFIVVLANT